MGFLTKKRSDGVYVQAREAFSMIMPFLLPTRTESLVYYKMTVDISKTRAYLQKMRKQGVNLSFFNVVIASAVRTLGEFPKANRFIAGLRLFQRNDLEVCYAVKREMAIEAEETVVKLKFSPNDTLADVAKRMNEENEDKREGAQGADDKLVKFFAHLPRFLIRFIVWALRKLDYHGIMPRALIDAIPFYCSVFVANLGSLGMQAPLHHLYEFGTCPFFMTVGRINKSNEMDTQGNQVHRMTVDLGLTVDERIVDGFYLSRVIHNFTQLIENPALIDESLKHEPQ